MQTPLQSVGPPGYRKGQHQGLPAQLFFCINGDFMSLKNREKKLFQATKGLSGEFISKHGYMEEVNSKK